jgi:hypothetical protein
VSRNLFVQGESASSKASLVCLSDILGLEDDILCFGRCHVNFEVTPLKPFSSLPFRFSERSKCVKTS